MVAVSLKKFFFQAEDGIRDYKVTGVQTCALPIWIANIRLTMKYKIERMEINYTLYFFALSRKSESSVVKWDLIRGNISLMRFLYSVL